MRPLPFDPETDLKIERVVDVPTDRVWRAWTEPRHLMRWFCPRPWTTVACEIELHPGGAFNTTMCSPDGERFPNSGCFLEVIPGRRLVWTDALSAGFRPAARGYLTNDAGFYVTGVITMEPVGNATRYTAMALHAGRDGHDKHLEMGFLDGWSTALDQLVEVCQSEM